MDVDVAADYEASEGISSFCPPESGHPFGEKAHARMRTAPMSWRRWIVIFALAVSALGLGWMFRYERIAEVGGGVRVLLWDRWLHRACVIVTATARVDCGTGVGRSSTLTATTSDPGDSANDPFLRAAQQAPRDTAHGAPKVQ